MEVRENLAGQKSPEEENRVKIYAQPLKKFLEIVEDEDLLEIQIHPRTNPNGNDILLIRLMKIGLAAQLQGVEYIP